MSKIQLPATRPKRRPRERSPPVLEGTGTAIIHASEIGMGQVFKMCNQLMGGTAGSLMLDILGPQVLAKDDSAGFRIDLQLKDVRLAGEAAFEKASRCLGWRCRRASTSKPARTAKGRTETRQCSARSTA